MDQRQTFWDKCFKDENGRQVLGQKPNKPQLLGWLALLVSWPLSGRAEHIAAMIAYGFWFTWAWLEITQGVNYFRRACGGAVFIILILLAIFH
jgi:hypothetical protein